MLCEDDPIPGTNPWLSKSLCDHNISVDSQEKVIILPQTMFMLSLLS